MLHRNDKKCNFSSDFAPKRPILFHKNEIDGANDEQEGQNVVPMQVVALKHNVRDDGENGQRNTFLNDFQLHERERTAVVDEAETVGRHLAAILEKGDGPREADDGNQRPVVADARLLQTKVAVPREGHKNVAENEQDDGVESVHNFFEKKLIEIL